MNDRAGANRYPSLEEFRGWYNLGYERDDGVLVVSSQDRIPEFGHGEFFQLYATERTWFEALVPAEAIKPPDPLIGPPLYVKPDADDRTLEVFPDFDYVTAKLILRIQNEFLGRHPLWRVVLAADDPSCSIVIYPEVIRFGSLPLGVDPAAALREIVPRAIAAREARLRPEREQLAFLQQRLPQAVRELERQPFSVVGILDNNLGNYDQLTIFLLGRGRHGQAAITASLARSPDNLISTSGGFDLNEAIRFICDTSQSNTPAFSVTLYHVPSDFRGSLSITHPDLSDRYFCEVASGDIARTVSTD